MEGSSVTGAAARVTRALFVAMLPAALLAAPASPAAAQTGGTAPGLPITVKAEPEGGVPGARIVLTGVTFGGIPGRDVLLAITPPRTAAGARTTPQRLQAAVGADGRYSVEFTETVREGTYNVEAVAPDGRGRTTTEFTIVSAGAMAEAVSESLNSGVAVALELAVEVAAKVDALPPSPARDEVRAEVERIVSQIRTVHGEIREARPAVEETVTQADEAARSGDPRTRPGAPDFETRLKPLLDQLTQQTREADRHVALAGAELERLRRAQATCDALEVVIEGLKLAGFMLNFVGSIGGILGNLANELFGIATEAATQAAGAPGWLSFGTAEVVKNRDLIRKPAENLGSVIGVVDDLIGKGAEAMMGRYCDVFTGPVEASMKAVFRQAGGDIWWQYAFKLSGRITVHYPKDAGRGRIPVKGRIEGFAHDFDLWENAFTVLFPGITAGSLYVKWLMMPLNPVPTVEFTAGPLRAAAAPPTDRAISAFRAGVPGGAAVGAHMPGSFFIEVTGEVDDDQITLRLGPARTDFDVQASVYVIALSVLTLMQGNMVHTYALPFKDARFVLERATGGDPVTIPITTEGAVMRGRSQLANQVGAETAWGSYRLSIDMCNPGC